MNEPRPFEVVSGDEFEPAELVAVLSTAYGQPFTEDWFHWKHREGPWGPSRCWVAVDDDGILGLMFGLPWVYEASSTQIPGARLVDGGSTPRARGKGVFRAVVAQELAQWDASTTPGILVATATPEAQTAHVKNGASALSPIHNAYGPTPRRRTARLITGAEVLETFAPDPVDRISTRWEPQSIGWRIDSRAGHRYEVAQLADSEEAHGIIYRVVSVRGIRVLVLVLTWGRPDETRVLIGAVARSTAAWAVLAPTGEGAAARPTSAVIRRGTALLCVWPRVSSLDLDPTSREAWSLSGADLEGAI